MSGVINFLFLNVEVANFVAIMSSFSSRRGHQFCSNYDDKQINITLLQINNNSVFNFSSLYKNIINITKYIITNNKYQITKIK